MKAVICLAALIATFNGKDLRNIEYSGDLLRYQIKQSLYGKFDGVLDKFIE